MNKRSFVLGVGCGLLFGVGMVIGTIVGISTSATPNASIVGYEIDGKVLQAATGDSSDQFAIATGKVSDTAEGVFMLDGLSGELQCIVPYTRTSSFGGLFKTNVFTDLKIEAATTPRFLMVTGEANFSGNSRPGNCIVYIVNADTGHYVAYGVPWNRQMETNGRAQQGQLVGLTSGKARNIKVRQ